MPDQEPVAGLLLAAGGGRRLGQAKALVRLGDRTLVERGVDLLAAAGCAPVLVVLGADAEQVRGAAAISGARVVVNDAWAEGMGSSLRAGLAAASDTTAGAVVVALVDQPLVGPEAVERLVQAWRAGATVAVATYADRRRNPVLLARSVWDEVALRAEGDVGARPFLAAHPELVTAVACDDVGAPDDIDTPADLEVLAARVDEPDAPGADEPMS